jgi:hypothetical protein
MKFHAIVSCEPEEICSICHQRPLQIIGRHRFEMHTLRYLILLSNNGYQLLGQYYAADQFNKTSFQLSASQYEALHEGSVLLESVPAVGYLRAAVLSVHSNDY